MDITLNFEPLTGQFKDLRDVLTAAVYSHRGGPTAVAMELGMTLPDLTRSLSGTEGRKCDIALLPQIVQATGDQRPVYWLVEKLCEDANARRDRALDDFIGVAADLHEMLSNPDVKAALAARARGGSKA